jgi:hypothetical protein
LAFSTASIGEGADRVDGEAFRRSILMDGAGGGGFGHGRIPLMIVALQRL